MRMKLRILAIISILQFFGFVTSWAYEPGDSVRIEQLLKAAQLTLPQDTKAKTGELVLFFAKQFYGVPYVAQTLDRDSVERLVVNTRELDCTTFVETVAALTLCAEHGKTRFADYCNQLQKLRYLNGEVSYFTRLHYFTTWIEDNERMGFVRKIQSDEAPFTAIQHLNVNWMSQHLQSYPMLRKYKECPQGILNMERELTGRSYRYIPKAQISNTTLMRRTIHNGDIIAILTNQKGLDTSHIGIAVWHKDGLHLINASQIHKKVVEEPMLLRTYMQKHPSQTGIRIARIL